MSKNSKEVSRITKFINSLAEGTDVHRALHNARISPGRALQILRGRRAKIIITACRAILKFQKDFILRRYSPAAATTLCRQLNADIKPDTQIKSALALLALAHPPKKSPNKNSKSAKITPTNADTLDSFIKISETNSQIRRTRAAKAHRPIPPKSK